MRALWSGGFHSHEGKHYTVDRARVFTLPDEPPPIHVAASGAQSIALAARAGGGMIATQPLARADARVRRRDGRRKAEVRADRGLASTTTRPRARRLAHERFRFAAPGWKVMAELPNPVNFEAATAHVREEDVAEMISCGPDLDRHAEAIRQWTDAGFDQVAIVQVGDPERFFEVWAELRPRLQD